MVARRNHALAYLKSAIARLELLQTVSLTAYRFRRTIAVLFYMFVYEILITDTKTATQATEIITITTITTATITIKKK